MTHISERVQALAPSATLAMSQKSNELKAQGVDVINLSVGEPDFETPHHIKEAAKRAIDENFTFYTPVPGYMSLRKAVSEKLAKENGVTYAPEQIVVSNGAKQALCNVILATINPGDEVLIPKPYWLTYPEIVKACGGVPVYVMAKYRHGYKVTASQIENMITPKTKMLIFNSPCNPTGAVYTEEEIRKIADVCERYDLTVISDEIYEKLIYGGETHFSIAGCSPKMKEQTILINGVSKSYAMTGWRLGYLAAPEHVAKAIASFQSHSTSNVNTMTQYAVIDALEGDKKPMEDMVATFGRRRAFMLEKLEKMKEYGFDYVKPDGAFYAMLLCDNLYGKSYDGHRIKGSADVAEMLLDYKKVALTPGVVFGDDDFIRLSYALDEKDIEEGLNRIIEFAEGCE